MVLYALSQRKYVMATTPAFVLSGEPTVLTGTWFIAAAGLSQWTGGDHETTRNASVEVIRTNPTLAAPLARAQAFH